MYLLHLFHPFTQFDAVSPTFKLLERFTIVLYSKNSNSESVDGVSMELVCQDNKAMESIPPTADALLQRSAYQVSVWTSSQDSEQRRPTPESWGWSWDECTKKWRPIWITQPTASNSCLELIKCACKSEKGCGARCSKKANWSCVNVTA